MAAAKIAAADAAEPSPRRGQRGRGERRRGEPGQVEGAPSGVAGAEEAERREMDQVDAREVHVEEVAVGYGTLADAPGDVMHQRRVVDQRPAARAPRQAAGQARERDEHEQLNDRSTLQ